MWKVWFFYKIDHTRHFIDRKQTIFDKVMDIYVKSVNFYKIDHTRQNFGQVTYRRKVMHNYEPTVP